MSKPLFVAFSDPHVGRVWGSHAVPSTREKLTDRYLDPIHEVVSEYAQKGVPVICGGDWFDRAHNSERTIQASIPLLEQLRAVLAGNHDHAGRESAVTSMDLIDGLMDDGTTIIRSEDHLNAFGLSWLDVNGVGIYCVPHAGTQALFEEACYKAANAARGESGYKVLVVHANVGPIGGGKPDSCLYMTPQLLAGVEDAFDFVLTGHEHLPKQIGKLIVLGSSQPCSFGELGERYFWEFWEEDGRLVPKKVRIKSQITTVNYDIATLLKAEDCKGAELVDLHGHLPINQARNVQRLVKEFFASGTLAVRMGVTFDSGAIETGDQVERSMKNLVDVVRGEIQGNEAWLGLLDEALSHAD